MSIGIYKLFYEGYLKIYIGKSLDISSRYKEHIRKLKNNSHSNYLLQEIFNKTSKFPILEIVEEITNISILNDMEIFWINKYNSFNAGYNLTIGGDTPYGEGSPAGKYTEEQYLSTLESLANTDLTYEEIQKITSVHINTISNMAMGISQVYLKALYPTIYNKMLFKRGIRNLKYSVSTYIKALYLLINTTDSIGKISRDLNIEQYVLYGILQGKYSFLNNIDVAKVVSIRPMHKHIEINNIEIISPEGTVYKILGSQKEFADLHKLNRTSLSGLLNGKLKVCQGWRLNA